MPKDGIVRSIYIYFFIGVGLLGFLAGVFLLGQSLVKQFMLPRYYLDYDETRCDYITPSAPPDYSAIPISPAPSDVMKQQQESEKQKQDCLAKLEEQRKVRKITDFSTAVLLIVIGGAVFASHRKMLEK